MNANFNSQFILLDFELLDSTEFLAFTGSNGFSVYLLLRRYVWRSTAEHTLGLHHLYQAGYLVSSLSDEVLAERLQKGLSTIREFTRRLEELKLVVPRLTGRQKIYLLGEWVDISEVGDATKKQEWFYLDRIFQRTDNPEDRPPENR